MNSAPPHETSHNFFPLIFPSYFLLLLYLDCPVCHAANQQAVQIPVNARFCFLAYISRFSCFEVKKNDRRMCIEEPFQIGSRSSCCRKKNGRSLLIFLLSFLLSLYLVFALILICCEQKTYLQQIIKRSILLFYPCSLILARFKEKAKTKAIKSHQIQHIFPTKIARTTSTIGQQQQIDIN
jgi:hypothetical protein